MMLNDSMYGILFRDINPMRTFVDQRFSRQIHARAGHHHQHRRGQLPHHRRRRRGGAHRDGEPAAQRVLRQGGRAGGLAARPGARVRDQPRGARLLPPRAGARAARPAALPGRAAEVDAADEAHDRRRLPRLPARRVLQPGGRDDRPGDPAGRDDDRGRRHAVPLRPRPGAAERPLRAGRRRQAARGLPPGAQRLHQPARQPGAGRGGRAAGADHRGARRHRAAVGDRRRDVRTDEAAGRCRQGLRRRRGAGPGLRQPGDRHPRGWKPR